MSKSPPLLPDEVLRRVLRMAHLDGTGLLVVAGAFALVSAWYHDTTGTVVGLVVAGTGAIELHGAGLLRHGRERGVNWLIASQLGLMGAVCAYVGWQLAHIDPAVIAQFAAFADAGSADDAIERYAQLDPLTKAEMLQDAYVGFYEIVFALTVIYQGGMTIYYARRRARVITALREIHGHD